MNEFVLVAGKPTIEKDPDAELDYIVKFGDWLEPNADSIEQVLSVIAVGVTIDSADVLGSNVVLWVSGGEVGQPASVTVRVRTTGGRVDDRTIHFKIKQR